jgi:hypothetical protein
MYPHQDPQPPYPQPPYPQPPYQQAPAAPPKQPPLLITAQPGSPLTDLLDRREAARAELAEVTARVDALTAAIKDQTTGAVPEGTEVIDIDSPGRRRLRLAWRQGNRLDTARLKLEQRPIYDAYLRPGKGYWDLRELSGS